MKKRLLSILLVLFLTCLIGVLYSLLTFSSIQQKPFYKGNNKAWSHRGVANTTKEENSIQSIQKAVDRGYAGVEIDLWYRNKRFYLTHDENYSADLTSLDAVFQKFPETLFWLDLKNLSLANTTEINDALENLNGSKSNFLIESKNALALSQLSNEGFYTSLWIQPNNQPLSKLWFSYSGILEVKNILLLRWLNFNAVSMPYLDYKKHVRKRYGHLNIHCWIKQSRRSSTYQNLSDHNEVKIILTDENL